MRVPCPKSTSSLTKRDRSMKLLIIRHGDPDYSMDSLTEKGWREAELLAERIAPMEIKAYYVSPLGRAQDTASVTLKKAGRKAQMLAWLREFDIQLPGAEPDKKWLTWDVPPHEWSAIPEYYDKENWCDMPELQECGIKARMQEVHEGLDRLLEAHGYKREGNHYRIERANDDTIVMICHYGIQCAMLAHLIGVSPMTLWHGLSADPTAVTVVATDERTPGVAEFRIHLFGDTSHLVENR